LGSFASLFRLLPVSKPAAAHLAAMSTIAVCLWTGPFVGLSILAIFYQRWFEKHLFWAFYLPVVLSILASIGTLGLYLSLPDRAGIVVSVPGTHVYDVDYQAFPVRAWGVVYTAAWAAVSLVLLIVAAVRRRGGERRSAAILSVLVLLPGVTGSLGSRVFPGTLRILGPALSSALLFIAFAYVAIRYHLFSTEEVAVSLALDNLRDGMLVLSADQVVLSCNARAAELLGMEKRAVAGRRIDDVLAHSALPGDVWRDLWADLQEGQGSTGETRYVLGQMNRVIENEVMPIEGAGHSIQGYVWMIRDVTELRRSEEQLAAHSRELEGVIADLRDTTEVQDQLLATIRSLSAPAVPILQGIIVMPLSGQIDSDRARRILDNLLAGIDDHLARVAIIDITGVPVVDTAVAQHLIQAARAALLMGCRSLLVGIRPEIAQVIVELGIDMSGLATFSDLQSGVEYATRLLGIELVHTTAR
jgi:rsbT co-antagonist protein RsbR